MTNNFGPYYSGTARPAKKVGPRQWKSEIWLVRRDTEETVEKLEVMGTTEVSAMTNGLRKAKAKAETLGAPKEWKR
jgi:hypothetical protein